MIPPAEETRIEDDVLRPRLESVSTIAVIGASTDPAKPANGVPSLLLAAGYTVIPVHPTATEILGQRAYRSLPELPGPVEVVDVFRPAAEAPAIAEQAVASGAGAVWLQLGVRSPQAASIARRGGLAYVEDRCLGETVHRLGIGPAPPSEEE